MSIISHVILSFGGSRINGPPSPLFCGEGLSCASALYREVIWHGRSIQNTTAAVKGIPNHHRPETRLGLAQPFLDVRRHMMLPTFCCRYAAVYSYQCDTRTYPRRRSGAIRSTVTGGSAVVLFFLTLPVTKRKQKKQRRTLLFVHRATSKAPKTQHASTAVLS